MPKKFDQEAKGIGLSGWSRTGSLSRGYQLLLRARLLLQN